MAEPTRRKPVAKEALLSAGCLYADTVQEAFRKYQSAVLSAQRKEDLRDFLRAVYQRNPGAMYADFYYPVLPRQEQERFRAGLSGEQREILETLDTESGRIFYPVTEKELDFLYEITAAEWLFSSFYAGNQKALIWGNYGLNFPIFCEEEETLEFYLGLAQTYKVRWNK